jgi:hypothetical protein
MEAIRSIHVPDAHVELRGDSVLIESLLVNDRTLAELVARRVERDLAAEETVLDALEIGARVLDREATGAEVDLVRSEFERVSADVERAFADRARSVAEQLEKRLQEFLGEDGGTMSRALDAHAGQVAEQLAQHFGGDRSTAVQHQIRETTAKLLQDSRQDLLRQFSAEDGHNPLADFKASVVREMKHSRQSSDGLLERLTKLEGEIQRLHDARDAGAELAAEQEAGTRKGRAFEERVFEAVESIATPRGDVAHHVGDVRSESGGKRGDVVIEVEAASGPAQARIALDAKDERLSKNKAWQVLNEALVERDASFAILVVASEDKVPAGREPLQEYEGNKMIVALDKETLDPRGLELAYRYARCRALMATETGLEVDAAGVRDAAEEALTALRDAQKIRSSLTGATKSVESARDTLEAMVGRVRGSLERVESLIAAAGSDAPAA